MRGSQLLEPRFEYPGASRGEAPYLKGIEENA